MVPDLFQVVVRARPPGMPCSSALASRFNGMLPFLTCVAGSEEKKGDDKKDEKAQEGELCDVSTSKLSPR
jgi:hypothetical protein